MPKGHPEPPAENPLDAARAQQREYFGYVADERLPLPDGTEVVITNPAMFSDEQQDAWDEVQLRLQSCEREPDIEIPTHKLHFEDKDGNKTETLVPASIQRGGYKQPLRIVTPEGVERMRYNVEAAIAVLGKEEWERAHALGLQAGDVMRALTKMQRELNERRAADSKSDRGAAAVEEVSEAD
ncbi:hypothetical protein [Mycolicibacterium goodii]|uniref:hypothetical protein n=1 Tax=Mycolicibacterium goodii TaxID=134601 RepID=UPI001BDCFCBE|nr:hypothetical protein [Mycolicibacterium goodii]MBU8833598.1 hypothetical protein [Mycolicibacterium goodii]